MRSKTSKDSSRSFQASSEISFSISLRKSLPISDQIFDVTFIQKFTTGTPSRPTAAARQARLWGIGCLCCCASQRGHGPQQKSTCTLKKPKINLSKFNSNCFMWHGVAFTKVQFTSYQKFSPRNLCLSLWTFEWKKSISPLNYVGWTK